MQFTLLPNELQFVNTGGARDGSDTGGGGDGCSTIVVGAGGGGSGWGRPAHAARAVINI